MPAKTYTAAAALTAALLGLLLVAPVCAVKLVDHPDYINCKNTACTSLCAGGERAAHPKPVSRLGGRPARFLAPTYHTHRRLLGARCCRNLGSQNPKLTGSIPTEIGTDLSALTDLSVNNNILQGTLPSELALLSALNYLRLDSNILEGTLPTGLAQTALTYFSVNSNSLQGTLPTELAQLTTLITLYDSRPPACPPVLVLSAHEVESARVPAQ